YANGFLEASALCPLVGASGALRADAAAAFARMTAAHRADRGSGLCVTDSYRPYAAQVSVYRRKPHLAAVPGTSRHGLGIALDLGCGVQRFGSASYRWMKANGPRFGWVHPGWAEPGGSMPEPWHWEYVGG
ncbi:MAG: D-alanyl-D-alanine carboxypeptidase, partial [Frankiales bacterium]|nr:D-alanyl-D-alanine carboxypeptidase [Frankiales bacterium]